MCAIVLSAAIVFLISGLTASAAEIKSRRRLQIGLGVGVAATIAVMMPLAQSSIARHDEQQDAAAIRAALGPGLDAESSTVEHVTVERLDGEVRVVLEAAGPQPPDADELASAVADELGEAVDLRLLWRFGDRAAASS